MATISLDSVEVTQALEQYVSRKFSLPESELRLVNVVKTRSNEEGSNPSIDAKAEILVMTPEQMTLPLEKPKEYGANSVASSNPKQETVDVEVSVEPAQEDTENGSISPQPASLFGTPVSPEPIN